MLGGLIRRFRRAQSGAVASGADDSLIAQGLLHERRGEHEAAERCYLQAIEVDPAQVAAHLHLGSLLGARGDLDRSQQHLEAVLAAEPGSAHALGLLGNVHRARGDGAAAERCYRAALDIDPQAALASHNLGGLLREQSRNDEAVDILAHALRQDPLQVDSLTHYVQALVALGRADEARAHLESLVTAHPDAASVHEQLGALILKHWFDASPALVCFERAGALGLDSATLHANWGIALQDLGRVEESLAHYARALERDPSHDRARWQRALLRLQTGDFAAGWPDYELRLQDQSKPVRRLPYPSWRGESLEGRTVLVLAEQGIGDEIMFASCIPDLLARGARPVIDCSPRLAPLFARSFATARVRGGEQTETDAGWARAFEPIDYQVHAGSLPLQLRSSLDAFPAHRGYLRAAAADVDRWRAELDVAGRGLKVGFTWRGGTRRSRAPLRSLAIEQLEPLFDVPGARFVSLQHDARADEIDRLRERHGVVHWRAALSDLDQTAALLGALDLIITVCNSIVHLSGALGRPVWVMAPYSPEWRYLRAGQTLPWYPSSRVLRQPAYGDWASVLSRTAGALRERVSRGY